MSIELALVIVLLILVTGYLAAFLAPYEFHARDLVSPRTLMGAVALGAAAVGAVMLGAVVIRKEKPGADRGSAEFKGGADKTKGAIPEKGTKTDNMSRPMRRKNMPHRKAELRVSGYTPEEIEAVDEVCGIASRGAEALAPVAPAKLADLTKKLKYRAEFPSDLLTQLHYGQRKLLMSEVDFLTRRGGESANVVYAGAAPGEHIPYLAQLFPKHRFILYDPAPYRIKEKDLAPVKDRIEMHQEYFTDGTAEALAKKYGGDMLFVSDIRAVEDDMTHSEFEARVEADQEWQRKWVEIMKPRGSLLKFRIPFSEKYSKDGRPYRYLDGDIHLQVWAPKTSAETRIELGELGEPGELGELGERDYYLPDYEQKLFYHNIINRDWVSYLDHIEELAPGLVASGDVPGLDGCYDCAREVAIWAAYCAHSQCTIADLANRASEVTGQRLDKYPHGAEPTVPMCEKRKNIITPSQRKMIERLSALGGKFPNAM